MENDSPCFAILEGTFRPNGQKTPEFEEYSRRSNANGQAHDGKLLGRYVITENLGQGQAPHVVFVVEFPSRAMAHKAFTNPEYLAIIPLRNVAFEEVKILLSDGAPT